MCAKSNKLVAAAKAAGYQVNPSVRSFSKCPTCGHKTVITFIKNNLKGKGPKRVVACFTCRTE